MLIALAIEIVLFAALFVEYERRGGLHGGGPLLGVLLLLQLPGVIVAVLLDFLLHLAGDGSALDRVGETLTAPTILATQIGLIVFVARVIARLRERGVGDPPPHDVAVR